MKLFESHTEDFPAPKHKFGVACDALLWRQRLLEYILRGRDNRHGIYGAKRCFSTPALAPFKITRYISDTPRNFQIHVYLEHELLIPRYLLSHTHTPLRHSEFTIEVVSTLPNNRRQRYRAIETYKCKNEFKITHPFN